MVGKIRRSRAVGSVSYYRQVSAPMNDARDFFRLFMVPGMLHCGGGPGQIIRSVACASDSAQQCAENDILSALGALVEQGVAPERLVAVKYVNQSAGAGDCAHAPALRVSEKPAVYSGQRSTDDAATSNAASQSTARLGAGAE